MSILSNLDLIRRVPLFMTLTAEQGERVASGVAKKRYGRNEVLVQEGMKSNALFILLNGRARVLKTDERGREVIMAHMGQGDFVGEMSLIDHEPHSATVQAEIPTDVLVLTREAFAACLPETDSVAYAVLVGLVQRLRAAGRKIESLALMDVYGRVAHALLEQSHTLPDGRVVVLEKVSRQDLAKSVGASREMVSRVMKDLEDRGIIQLLPDGSLLLREQPTLIL